MVIAIREQVYIAHIMVVMLSSSFNTADNSFLFFKAKEVEL